jgi:hypothetical protein
VGGTNLINYHCLRIAPERREEASDHIYDHHESSANRMQAPKDYEQVESAATSDGHGQFDVCLIDRAMCAGHKV